VSRFPIRARAWTGGAAEPGAASRWLASGPIRPRAEKGNAPGRSTPKRARAPWAAKPRSGGLNRQRVIP